jgi:hypothetical protein
LFYANSRGAISVNLPELKYHKAGGLSPPEKHSACASSKLVDEMLNADFRFDRDGQRHYIFDKSLF